MKIDIAKNFSDVWSICLNSKLLFHPNIMALTVKKNNAIIHISNAITGFERRLYNELLGIAQPDLAKGGRAFSIPVVEILQALNVDIHSQTYLRQSIKALVETSIEINLLGKDPEEMWELTSLLSWAKLDDGILAWEYPNQLAEQLGRPNTYTILPLLEMRQLDSKYTLTLYELIKSFEKVKRTGKIPIDILQKLMGVEYADVRDFFKFVLSPALRELQQKTGWNIEEKRIKKGRSIAALQFVLKPTESAKIPTTTKKTRVGSTIKLENGKDYEALALGIPTSDLDRIIEEAKRRVPDFVLENFTEDTTSFLVSYQIERDKLIDEYYQRTNQKP